MRTVIVWLMRLVAMAVVGAAILRVLHAAGGTGDGVVPTIGGDTWPPVPVNPASDS